MATILIKNGRVWDGERFLRADVLTAGDIIAKIEPDISAPADFVFDAEGMTVSAGLVDLHAHLRVTPDDVYGIQAEMSCFPFGVTAAADAGRIEGERVVMDSFMLKNLVFVSACIKNDRVEPERTLEALRRFGDKVAGIKVYFDTDTGEVKSIAPLKEVCELARSLGLRVMVHCTGSPTPMSEVLGVLREGDILTHAFHGGIGNAGEDDFESMRAAQARGVIIDAGMAGHVHTDFEVMRRAIESGVIPNTVSTDITKLSAYMRGGRYGMTACMSISRLLGLSEESIFRAVTAAPAEALGKGDEWGRLAVGRRADIAVLNYTDEGFDLTDKAGNRIHSTEGYRCALTVSDGQVVFRD